MPLFRPGHPSGGASRGSSRGFQPAGDDDGDDDRDDGYQYDPEGVPPMVEIGQFPKLATIVLRRRLETVGITVMVEWTDPGPDAVGTILVPEPAAEFAEAVVNELDVDDEVPDTSPSAYLGRIEEHLTAIGGLLEELRARVELVEAGESADI